MKPLYPVLPKPCIRNDGTVIYDSVLFHDWLRDFAIHIKARFPKMMNTKLPDNVSMLHIELNKDALGLSNQLIDEINYTLSACGNQFIISVNDDAFELQNMYPVFEFRVCALVEHNKPSSYMGLSVYDSKHYANIHPDKADGYMNAIYGGRMMENSVCVYDVHNFAAYNLLRQEIMRRFGNAFAISASKHDFNSSVLCLLYFADFIKSGLK